MHFPARPSTSLYKTWMFNLLRQVYKRLQFPSPINSCTAFLFPSRALTFLYWRVSRHAPLQRNMISVDIFCLFLCLLG